VCVDGSDACTREDERRLPEDRVLHNERPDNKDLDDNGAAFVEQPARALLQLASYNVHRCVGGDYRYDPSRIARVIQETGCDTIALQEVDNKASARADSMQLDYLAQITGMQSVAGQTIIHHEGHYGNALLTRREIVAVRRHDFSYAGYEPRGALDVDLQDASGIIRLIVTHLGLRSAERRVQIRQLMALIESTPPDQPVIVAGDMNEWLPWSRTVKWMNTLCGSAPATPSFPAWHPLLSLDRVWTRAPHRVTHLHTWRSPLSRVASDHLPVIATVSLGNR
jgi:endonuclease/exonuclease/phosphatase family metal-dependent hydrolase